MAKIQLLRGFGADGNDNLILITEVKSNKPEYLAIDEDHYINDATVEVTIYEEDKTTLLAGVSWPLVCTYVPDTDGWYGQTLQDGIAIPNDKYWVVLVILGDGLKATASGFVPVVDRAL